MLPYVYLLSQAQISSLKASCVSALSYKHCFCNEERDKIAVFLCLVPDHGPLSLTGFNISSTALNISWSLIPKEYRNGIITGYRVHFDDNIHHSGSITLPFFQRNVVLEGLLSYSLYNISVAGLTRKGEGWSRTSVMIRTDAGGRCRDNILSPA